MTLVWGEEAVQNYPQSSICKTRQDGSSLAPYLVWNLNSLSLLKLGVTINYGRRTKTHCEVMRYFSEPDTRNLLCLLCETDARSWVLGAWPPEQKLLPPTSQSLRYTVAHCSPRSMAFWERRVGMKLFRIVFSFCLKLNFKGIKSHLRLETFDTKDLKTQPSCQM